MRPAIGTGKFRGNSGTRDAALIHAQRGATINLTPLVNKTVTFRFMGADLRLDLSHALFSSFDIDQGTRMLLKAVARDEVLARSRRVLDAGSGTGVIGLCIAKAFGQAEVVMRDRDLLAVAFSERNRLQNRLGGITSWTDPTTGISRKPVLPPQSCAGLLADGFEGGPYDFILSNLPAKAGAPVLEAFFRNCGGTRILARGGRVAVVIVNTLAEKAGQWLAESGLTTVKIEKGGGHSVFIAEKPLSSGSFGEEAESESPGLSEVAASSPQPVPAIPISGESSLPDMSLYLRHEGSVIVGSRTLVSRGYWGLPDFDTVNHATNLAADTMNRTIAGSLIRECLFMNPGVGHLALWVSRVFGPRTIRIASRDTLSLLAVRDNLSHCGYVDAEVLPMSSLDLDSLKPASADLVVWNPDLIPEFDWIEPAWTCATSVCKTGACLVLASTPTELMRFDKHRPAGWKQLADKRRRGMAVMVFRRE